MPTLHFETTGLLIFAACAMLPLLPPIHFGFRAFRMREHAARRRDRRLFVASSLLAAVIYAAVTADAFLLEPNWPRVRHARIEAPFTKPLRILHLSDLHIEESLQSREAWLIDQVKALAPDIIFITGDTHQMDVRQTENLRHVLRQINAPLGVYGCVGYDNTSMLMLAAPHIPYLVNQTQFLEWNGHSIGIAGVSAFGNRAPLYEKVNDADWSIVISHTPDLADEAAAAGIDLYLCGHTHGGQVRIPFWGAIITNSKSGKKYESGLYRNGDTTIHTSRGLGLEPPPAPQVRFFCRPEITLIQIIGS